MVMYANDFKTKENQKINCNIYIYADIEDDILSFLAIYLIGSSHSLPIMFW